MPLDLKTIDAFRNDGAAVVRGAFSVDSGNCERVYVKLTNTVAGANQSQKLTLRGLQRRVRHHV